MKIWERIDQTENDYTERMAVPGGWLVCRVNGLHLPQSLASWFVADPDHNWPMPVLTPVGGITSSVPPQALEAPLA